MMKIRFDKPFWRVRPMQVGVGSFAFLAGLEAIIRGMTLSVYPLVLYHAFGSAVLVSKIYFIIGVLSLFIALWVPLISTYIPRRWVYSFGMLCYVIAGLLGIYGGKVLAFALMLNSIATAISFVCYNAYVLS
ncbi:MAG: MFS transporter, partial [Paracoccaceae bacterium]|nr:MFS transporter [Paracoccaceae bacterium]